MSEGWWGDFKSRGKGILADPSALMTNPWFTAGMGILSENQKAHGGDPFGAVLSGVKSAKEQKQKDEDRKRQEELRKQLKRWMAAQAGHKPPGGGMTPNPYGYGNVPVAGSRAAANAMGGGAASPGTAQIGPPGQPPSPEQFQQALMSGNLPGMKTLQLLYGGGLDRMLMGR